MKFQMKVMTSLLVVAMMAAAVVASSSSSSEKNKNKKVRVDKKGMLQNVEELFADWVEAFDKAYKSRGELLKRMEIWTANHLLIEEHNNQRPKPSYELGHNQFSDLTLEEFQQLNNLGGFSPGIVTPPAHKRDTAAAQEKLKQDAAEIERRARKLRGDLPDRVDWVEAGAVVPVKNQGMCGSCWAFSAVGAIEGAHFLSTGELVSLSENELIDCDPLDMGCSGGLMDNAFLFDENSTGICSEEDYPYAGRKHWFKGCYIKKGLCSAVPGTEVKTFVDVPNTVDDLKAAIAQQPVSVAIEADKPSFQFYKSGIYDDVACGNQLDHGVLAVGYGADEDDTGYFLVRNSWGATWGDQGYIKMATESATVNGTCGILSVASRPILKTNEQH